MANLSINPDEVSALVTKAILDAMTQEAREKLIKDAIVYLMTPERAAYGQTSLSPIEGIFRAAVHSVAREVVTDIVQNDPSIREKIREIGGKVFERALSSEEKLNQMATTLVEAMMTNTY